MSLKRVRVISEKIIFKVKELNPYPSFLNCKVYLCTRCTGKANELIITTCETREKMSLKHLTYSPAFNLLKKIKIKTCKLFTKVYSTYSHCLYVLYQFKKDMLVMRLSETPERYLKLGRL